MAYLVTFGHILGGERLDLELQHAVRIPGPIEILTGRSTDFRH
jgi:hypothetical protein